MPIFVDEYEPLVDVQDDPHDRPKDVRIRYEPWVTAEYTVNEVLGRGRFGEVKRVRHVGTGKEYAAKFILAPRPQDKKDVENELEIMKKMKHKRLLQVFDAFCSKAETCLILEIIQGGELFERVIDDTFVLTEKSCICFVRQICEGVHYMHSNNIIHLDLKPENILCLTKTGNRIKIIDFGLAREYNPKKDLRVLFGTPEFMAPEIVQYDTINFATDMWSMGVIAYVLLSGLSPFMGDLDNDTLTNVIKVDYSFDFDEFDEISDLAKKFISQLLQKDKRQRLTSKACLEHQWLKKDTNHASTSLKQNQKNLKHFFYKRKWKKAVHCIIALGRMGASLNIIGKSRRSLTRREALARQQALRAAKASPAVIPRGHGSASTSGHLRSTNQDNTATASCSPAMPRTNNNDHKGRNNNVLVEQRQEPYANRSHCSDSTLLCESRLGTTLDGDVAKLREKSPARSAKQWTPRAKYGATTSMSGETHSPAAHCDANSSNHGNSCTSGGTTSPDNGSAVRALRGALTQWPPEPGYRRKRPDIRVIEAPMDGATSSSKTATPSSPTSKVTGCSRSAPLFGLGQNSDDARRGEQRANMQTHATKTSEDNSRVFSPTTATAKPTAPPVPAKKHAPATQPKPAACQFLKKTTPLVKTTPTPSPKPVEMPTFPVGKTSSPQPPKTPPKTTINTGKTSKHNPTNQNTSQITTAPKTSTKHSPKVAVKPVSIGAPLVAKGSPSPVAQTDSATIANSSSTTTTTATTSTTTATTSSNCGVKARKNRGSGLTRNRPGSRFTRKDEVEGTIFLNVKSSSSSQSAGKSRSSKSTKTKTTSKTSQPRSTLTPAVCPEDGTVSDISDAGSSKSGQVADAVAKWSNIGCKQQDYSTWRKPMTRLFR